MCFTSARTAPSASDACLRPLVPTLAACVPPQHVHTARTAGQLATDLRAVKGVALIQRSDDQLRSNKQRESAPSCSHKLLGTLLRLTVLWSASPCASAALLLASRRLHSCATSATILSSRRSTSSLSDAVSARGDGSPAPTTTEDRVSAEERKHSVCGGVVASHSPQSAETPAAPVPRPTPTIRQRVTSLKLLLAKVGLPLCQRRRRYSSVAARQPSAAAGTPSWLAAPHAAAMTAPANVSTRLKFENIRRCEYFRVQCVTSRAVAE